MQEGRQDQNKRKVVLSPTPNGLITTAAVYTVTIISSLLVGVITLFIVYVIIGHKALNKFIKILHTQWISLSLFIHTLLMILTITFFIIFLIAPALKAFLVNFKWPVLTNWRKALLNGIVFLLFCISIISIASYTFNPPYAELSQYELTQHKLLFMYDLLISSLLSLSVILIWHIGFSLGIRRYKKLLPDF